MNMVGVSSQYSGFISLPSMYPLESNTWASLMPVKAELWEGSRLLTCTKVLVLLVRKKNRMVHLCEDSYSCYMPIPLTTDLSENRAEPWEVYIFDRERSGG